jgi:hypothetical protein
MAQGTVKDNLRDELDEAAGWGRCEREERKEATPKEVRQPDSGGARTTSRTSGASPSGEGQVLREATRPIEIADLHEVSNLRKSTGDRVEIVGRETHAPPNPVAAVSTYGMRVTRRASAKQRGREE